MWLLSCDSNACPSACRKIHGRPRVLHSKLPWYPMSVVHVPVGTDQLAAWGNFKPRTRELVMQCSDSQFPWTPAGSTNKCAGIIGFMMQRSSPSYVKASAALPNTYFEPIFLWMEIGLKSRICGTQWCQWRCPHRRKSVHGTLYEFLTLWGREFQVPARSAQRHILSKFSVSARPNLWLLNSPSRTSRAHSNSTWPQLEDFSNCGKLWIPTRDFQTCPLAFKTTSW